jgi:hypothetical protein
VTRDRTHFYSRTLPAARHMIGFQTMRVKHLFQADYRAIMQQQWPIPNASKRGDFVESGALTGSQRDPESVPTETLMMSALFG